MLGNVSCFTRSCRVLSTYSRSNDKSMQVIAKKHQVCFEVLGVESIMSLFQFGFTVINETLQDSVPQSQSTNVAAVRYLPEQKDNFLRDDEYSEVVLSV